jgi:DNA-binding Xre family transcriptional regulator
MTTKLAYRWRLREVMATKGMFSTTDLRPMLAERGVELSPSQIYRLVIETPERLNLKVLMALLDILGCSMEDLIEPVAAAAPRAKKTADGTEISGVGQFRPKRARITRPS